MIEIKHVTKTFGNKTAVDHIDLTIPTGEIIGFIGPNGAGKTTTIKMMSGVLEPDEGDILIDGKSIRSEPLEAKRRFGLVPDSPDMFLRLKGIEYLNFMGDIYDVESSLRAQRIASLAETFEMRDALNDKILSYSHGMRQKIVLMGALIHEPQVWILDEPMTGLDPQSSFHLKQMMKEHAAKDKTVFFSTHVLEVAEKLCDKIAIINFGVLQQFGTPAEVYDDPVNEFVASFIGEPPMNILETTIIGDGDHFLFTFEDSDLQIKVPERYNNVVSNGFKCKMGVRPMDVLVGGPDSHGMPEKVATFENLGDERRIGIRVGETLLMLITDDETRYKADDIIKLEVRGEKTHLFDLETGNRIRE